MLIKIILYVITGLISIILFGFGLNTLVLRVTPSPLGAYNGSMFDLTLLLRLDTYIYGLAVTALFMVLILIFKKPSAKKAKKLMLETNMTISEIADTLGYDSSSSFIRFFKKNSGLSPAEYRKVNGSL